MSGAVAIGLTISSVLPVGLTRDEIDLGHRREKFRDEPAASTIAAALGLWHGADNVHLRSPENWALVNESDPVNARYVQLKKSIRWNPRFGEYVRSVLPDRNYLPVHCCPRASRD